MGRDTVLLDKKVSQNITASSKVSEDELAESLKSSGSSTPSSGVATPNFQHACNLDPEAGAAAPPATTSTPDNLDSLELSRVLTHLSISAPPDGGYGWINVALVFLINAHTWGLNSSYGVFLAHYLSSNTFPGATHLQFAFIGGLSVGCAFLISPLVPILIRHNSTSTTLLLGASLEALSLLSASFATEVWHLALSQGVAFGLGMGLLFVGSVSIVSQWFSSRRSLANGLATSGSGIGGLIYSLATGTMLRTLGQAWTFRVLALLAFTVNASCALLVRDRYTVIGPPPRKLRLALLWRLEYGLLLGFAAFSMLGYIVLLFSLASYARSLGLSSTESALVSALMNLAQAVGRPLVGWGSDLTGRINMAASASFLAGLLTLVIWPLAEKFAVLVVFALLLGLVAGTFFATISPLAAEVVGLEHVSAGLGLVWLVLVVPCTVAEVVGLQTVKAEKGRYVGVAGFSGAMYVAAAGCLVLLRGWKIGEMGRERREVGKGGTEKADGLDERAVESRWRRFARDVVRWRKV